MVLSDSANKTWTFIPAYIHVLMSKIMTTVRTAQFYHDVILYGGGEQFLLKVDVD